MYLGEIMDKIKLNYELDEFKFVEYNEDKYLNNTVEELEELIKKGQFDACYELGFRYISPQKGVVKDKAKGEKILKQGADNGDVVCAVRYILLKYISDEIPDFDKAIKETQKLLDAKHGEALVIYANMLYLGIGVDVDTEKAEQILQYCIDKKFYVALRAYFWLLDINNPIKKLKITDYVYNVGAEARKYCELAEKYAYKPDVGLVALDALRHCYMNGRGYIKRDVHKAYEICRKIVEKQPEATTYCYNYILSVLYTYKYDKLAFQSAQNIIKYNPKHSAIPFLHGFLGFLYMNGYGVEKDAEKAYKHITKAIDMGDNTSVNYLALLYKDGIYVKKDTAKAKELLEKTIEESVETPNTYMWLGKIYLEEKNYDKAEELFNIVMEKVRTSQGYDIAANNCQEHLNHIKSLKCHKCHKIVEPIKKKGFFGGEKEYCPLCNAKWYNWYQYDFDKSYKNYQKIVKKEKVKK